LEKDFGWKGILAEPAKIYGIKIFCITALPRLILILSGDVVNFISTPDAEFSAITSFKNKDFYTSSHSKG
jgi:hypothetical protein